MSWAIGFDTRWQRWIGYGVPAYCDHPDCNEVIDRGLSYVCGNEEPYGGDLGCGLYFCGKHGAGGLCDQCLDQKPPFTPKPEHPDWVQHQQTDPSWAEWRKEQNERAMLAESQTAKEPR
jgi:hypothetical protein